MNYFTLYDGTDATSESHTSLSFGVGLSGTGVWDAPARKGESISIPGRNGNIWVDDGSWENILVTYPCWIAEDFDTRVDDFRGWLARHSDKYYRITDTYHPDEYRLGRFSGEFLATPGPRNKSGRFDVVFECDPRRFLLTTISASGQIAGAGPSIDVSCNNPYEENVYPIIKLDFNTPAYVPIPLTTGSGSYLGSIRIGRQTAVTITDPDENTTIHTVYIDAATGATFTDADMITPIHIGGLSRGGLPGGICAVPAFLSPGANTIRFSAITVEGASDAQLAFSLSAEGYRL